MGARLRTPPPLLINVTKHVSNTLEFVFYELVHIRRVRSRPSWPDSKVRAVSFEVFLAGNHPDSVFEFRFGDCFESVLEAYFELHMLHILTQLFLQKYKLLVQFQEIVAKLDIVEILYYIRISMLQ